MTALHRKIPRLFLDRLDLIERQIQLLLESIVSAMQAHQLLRYSRYMDATGTHRLRGPQDVARYAAFIAGADPMEFRPYKILTPEQRRLRFRYADEVLYANEMYLLSLNPPKDPDRTTQHARRGTQTHPNID
jgi:hypothetical protein